jgi:dTDP-4-amino-4,6-dideoxygalactose transaminase
LDGISEKSQNYQHLCTALGESGLSRTSDDIFYEVSYIPWEGDWEAFLNTRSKKFRKNIRLTMNRLMALDGMEIVRMANPEDIESAVDGVLSIELRSWKVKHGEVVLHQPGYRDFFVEILRHYSGQGGSEAILLKYGDRTIGGLFGIIYEGTFYGLKMSYDEEFSSLSPGLILFKTLLEAASERKVNFIDLGKSTPFFARWTDSSWRHYKVIAFNERPLSRFLKYGHQTRTFLRDRLNRSTPASITSNEPGLTDHSSPRKAGDSPGYPPVNIPVLPTLSLSMILLSNLAMSLSPPLDTPEVRFYYSARYAIWHGLKVLGITQGDSILFPGYCCGSELNPILQAGIRPIFYRVDRNMKIDFDSLLKAIDGKTKALFLIHYFGFPDDLKRIEAICKSYNLFLIEDCAHALYSQFKDRDLGTFGEISIFSMWKTLPLPDGGALRINRPSLHPPDAGAFPPFDETVAKTKRMVEKDLFIRHKRIAPLIKDRVVQPLLDSLKRRRFRKGTPVFAWRTSDPRDFVPAVKDWGMSRVSQKILQAADRSEIVRKRRDNFLNLLRELKDVHVLSFIFDKLPDGVCPTFFPVIVDKRKKLHDHLLKNGIESYLFWAAFHPAIPDSEFIDATFLKTHVLALPVHQNLREEDLINIVKKIRDWKS